MQAAAIFVDSFSSSAVQPARSK